MDVSSGNVIIVKHCHSFKGSIVRAEFVPGSVPVDVYSSVAYKAGRNENSAKFLVRNCALS
jgi:hypothetical protein